MALVLGIVLLLPAAWAAAQTWLAWRAEIDRRLELLDRTAQLISAYQSDIVERTWTLLGELTEQPAILEGAEPACSEILNRELRQSGSYGNFAVVTRTGRVACAAKPDFNGADLGDRGWFREVMTTGGPVVSEVLDSRDGSAGRVVIAAVPLRDSTGPLGTVSVSLLLGRFTAVTNALPLPQGVATYVVDRAGTPLQFAAAGGLLTLPTPEENRILLAQPGAPVTLVDPDGRPWLYTASPIARGQLAVIASLPIEPWSWLRQDLLLGILVPTLMLALAVLAIWIATDYLVNRHIVALAEVASDYGRGRTTIEPPTAGAPDEIRALAQALALMAREVRARETELEASLAQKDLLLKEIHHRVKNNLQIVISLLNLRSQRVASTAAGEALSEAQTRIKALALVHRHLYEQHEVRAVDLHAFLGDLCALLEDSTAATASLEVDVAPVTVATDQAIPLALFVTEALTNALKHAFPDGRDGTVRVRLASHEGKALLEIADDGVGYGAPGPEEAGAGAAGAAAPPPGERRPPAITGGLGLTLIRMLARQVGGELQIRTGSGGTRLRLVFPPARLS